MSKQDDHTVIAFDLYGTLLSTASIASKLAAHFGEDKAATLAATWRKYQLEYTWRLNSMNQYIPFSDITRSSLIHTLSEANLKISDADLANVMQAYDSLSTFPDVPPALTALASAPNISAVVFSNGTQSMVANSVHHSAGLSPHASLFKDIITIDEVRKFKPAPEVYRLLARRVGVEDMGRLWLVSGNPFDVVGARGIGMKACWVSREGEEWVDGLVDGEAGRPTEIVRDLGEVVEVVRKHM